jgi:tetratricopeptide (TPR) repeat protein
MKNKGSLMTNVRRVAFLLIVAAALILAGSCAPAAHRPAATPPAPVDWPARLAQADALFRDGHLTALREAGRTYGEALAALPGRPDVAERSVRASIAIALREKQLGILPTRPAADPSSLVARQPALARYAPWLELLTGLACKVKGSPGFEEIGGRSLDAHFDWINARVAALDGELAAAAPSDDLAAALRLALRQEFSYKFQDKLAARMFLEAHPDSRLVAFQAAVAPGIETPALESLLSLEPEFAEVHYFLGEAALQGGQVLTAERHYLAAADKFPESLSVLISLAKVAFQTEETEDCLGWNERALALLPTYRDALLGKGLCLGALGRHEEALAVLGRLLELGTYYLGEGHYWTAWNLNELGRLEEARRSIGSAKIFLVGVPDVATLSGIIAYEQGRLDDAEKDLRQALDLDPGASDAAYHLGRLYADRKDWLDSGIYFAGAAMSYEDKERALEKRIGEIEASDMAPGRKAKLVAKKKAQIAGTQVIKATCQYNGAAGYHNAGSFERALDLARQAAVHPAFAEKAAALIKIIQGR